MKLVPLDDKVVLKKVEAEEKTLSGIVIPGKEKEKPGQGIVVAVGPGTEEIKMQVKVDDVIVFNKYAGTEVEVDEEKYLIVKQADILAIIK